MRPQQKYQAVIGLEVHCQLATASKMFCSCPTEFGQTPNSQTCPVCLGLPGALPVINRQAVEFAFKTALAVGATVHARSVFARKNYFYPDLPKGYQISQYDQPFSTAGSVPVFLDGHFRNILLTRIHLEEDAGKSLHGTADDGGTVVDLNRAGVPLIEIVGTPSLHTSEEAVAYLKALHAIVTSLGVCDGNMERGNFRCDANVSIRLQEDRELGTRVELKNLNSFRFVGKAIEYEIDRQVRLVENGETVHQQTRLFDQALNRTVLMRQKEDADDYRYFPEPDLLPLMVSPADLDRLRQSLPELPHARALRFKHTYGLSDYDATVLAASAASSYFFESTVVLGSSPKRVANWLMGEFWAVLNRTDQRIEQSKVFPEQLHELLEKIRSELLTHAAARSAFERMMATGETVGEVIEQLGLLQSYTEEDIAEAIARVVGAHPTEVAAYRSGKEKILGFLVGRVMKEMQGKGNPGAIQKRLKHQLTG